MQLYVCATKGTAKGKTFLVAKKTDSLTSFNIYMYAVA